MGSLEGSQVLVGGADTAIGLAIVQGLAEVGASVIALGPSDEAVEAAVASLGLADPDAVLPRGLEAGDLGSWWDVANLVAAFFHALDVFIAVEPVEPVEADDPDAAGSFALAMNRLKESLYEASREHGHPARVIAVTSPGAHEARHAALKSELADAPEPVGFASLDPRHGQPSEIAQAIMLLVSADVSHTSGQMWRVEDGHPVEVLSHSRHEGDPHAA